MFMFLILGTGSECSKGDVDDCALELSGRQDARRALAMIAGMTVLEEDGDVPSTHNSNRSRFCRSSVLLGSGTFCRESASCNGRHFAPPLDEDAFIALLHSSSNLSSNEERCCLLPLFPSDPGC